MTFSAIRIMQKSIDGTPKSVFYELGLAAVNVVLSKQLSTHVRAMLYQRVGKGQPIIIMPWLRSFILENLCTADFL